MKMIIILSMMLGGCVAEKSVEVAYVGQQCTHDVSCGSAFEFCYKANDYDVYGICVKKRGY